MVVAQLVDQWDPTPEACGSIAINSEELFSTYALIEMANLLKEKGARFDPL